MRRRGLIVALAIFVAAVGLPGSAAAQGVCFGGGFSDFTTVVGEELEASYEGGPGPGFDATVTVDWGDLNSETQRVRSGETVVFEHAYENEGQYNFTAQASGQSGLDEDGNPIPCSEMDSITITVLKPPCVDLEFSELTGGLNDWYVGWTPEEMMLGIGGNIAFTIDWGDGSEEVNVLGFAGDYPGDDHDYAAPGVYEVFVEAEGFLSQSEAGNIECENERTLLHTITANDDRPPPPMSVEVLFGAERTATAIAIAEEAFPGGAPAAVVARADIAPDALAGATLARALDAPLLLTAPDTVPARVGTALQGLLGDGAEVRVLGGTAALAPAIEEQLTAAGLTPSRVSGASRTETAIAIADATLATSGAAEPTAILVADAFGFADALIAGAAAAATGGVVVTTGPELPPTTQDFLDRFPGVPVFAIGSVAAQAVPGATPIVGTDVYDTSRLVAEQFYDEVTTVAVASGETFPDGLAGGPFAAARGAPLLLSAQSTLPAAVASYLDAVAPLTEVLVFGGPAALSDAVVAQLGSYVA